MRNGLLLAEGPPNYLMEVHECSNLEDVFLVLCKNETQTSYVTYVSRYLKHIQGINILFVKNEIKNFV